MRLQQTGVLLEEVSSRMTSLVTSGLTRLTGTTGTGGSMVGKNLIILTTKVLPPFRTQPMVPKTYFSEYDVNIM